MHDERIARLEARQWCALSDVDAERELLGWCIADPAVHASVRDSGVSERTFSGSPTRMTWRALDRLPSGGDRLGSLCDALGHMGELDAVGGKGALVSWVTAAAFFEHRAPGVARRLVDLARRRDAHRALADAAQRLGAGDALDDVALAVRSVLDMASVGASRFISASHNGASFAALDLDAPAPLLTHNGKPLLAAGDMALMFGRAGIGKTALAVSLGGAVARGSTWFGIETPEGGEPVGLLSLELPAGALQSRLRALGCEGLDDLHVISRPALVGVVDLDGAVDRAALRAFIAEKRLRLLIIDALVRVHATGEDDAGLAPLLQWLDALGRETGCAILLVHHERKADPNGREPDPLDAARGHSMLVTFPFVVWRVHRHGPTRCVTTAKATRCPEPEPFHFGLGDGGVPVPADAPELASARKGEEFRAKVRAAVTGSVGGMTAEAVEASTGLSRSTVRKHLSGLAGSGEVCKVPGSRPVLYRPSNRGSEPTPSDTSNALGLP